MEFEPKLYLLRYKVQQYTLKGMEIELKLYLLRHIVVLVTGYSGTYGCLKNLNMSLSSGKFALRLCASSIRFLLWRN